MDDTTVFKKVQGRIFTLLWFVYFSFYLVRLNFSVAMPGLMLEFGLTKTQLGTVLAAFFAAYAIGQLINGQIGSHLNSRYYISLGLILSSLINLVIGLFFCPNIAFLSVLWGLNGFFQSMGWSPIVKTVARWFSEKKRAKYLTILGTSYILGSAFALFLAGIIVSRYNWRFVFLLPSLISMFMALIWLYFGRESPERLKTSWRKFNPGCNELRPNEGFFELFNETFLNKKIILLGLALMGLNIVRYGFLDWGPTFFFEIQKISISSAAYKSLLFPIAGVLGALTAGYLSLKFFHRNYAKVACLMLFGLFICMLLFPNVIRLQWSISLSLLLIMGFLSFGPHVLSVSVLPPEVSSPRGVAAATGFIDCLGYVGAAVNSLVTGLLVDRFSWTFGLYFWLSGAALSLIMMLLLARKKIKA